MLKVIIGLMTGILTSMGFGGGTLLLLYLTAFEGMEHAKAAGINYLYFLPCAVISVFCYIKSKVIKPKFSLLLGLGAVIGAIIGAILSNSLDTAVLKKIFAIFVISIGLNDLFK